ncbi:MAG: formamidopyrimidine-DNA glycosylase [Planctomycetota bacterium]|jgi:formamidopyrimidine-DNA glycosylase
MPEYPHITVYLECISEKAVGEELKAVRIASPFLLRSVDPKPIALHGQVLRGVRNVGKRVVLEFNDSLFAVFHLMIAGRFAWRKPEAKLGSKSSLASLDFESGCLVLTEAGSLRRASLHIVQGENALAEMDSGGIDLFRATTEEFTEVMTRTNHTLKRALTDPRILSGIGNSFSDEILHAARLSPVQLTSNLDDDDWERLHQVCMRVLTIWTAKYRSEVVRGWPAKVSAFHPEMAAHGRYHEPCPVCQSSVQRILYASRETNYCATCQTGGRLLADRALSKLLKSDWPRTLEELEGRS